MQCNDVDQMALSMALVWGLPCACRLTVAVQPAKACIFDALSRQLLAELLLYKTLRYHPVDSLSRLRSFIGNLLLNVVRLTSPARLLAAPTYCPAPPFCCNKRACGTARVPSELNCFTRTVLSTGLVTVLRCRPCCPGIHLRP
jgi:hypothetical protein